MLYPLSAAALVIFALLVGAVLALSFYLGRKAKSAKGYSNLVKAGPCMRSFFRRNDI